MVPIKCGNCNHKQLWKCKDGPRLKDITCGNCGAAAFKRDTYAERKQRVITEAQAEDQAAKAPPPLPSELQLRHSTLNALERVATALEDLRDMGMEAGYGHAMLTGQRRLPTRQEANDLHAAQALRAMDEARNAEFNKRDPLTDQHEPAPGRVHAINEQDAQDIADRVRMFPRSGDEIQFSPGHRWLVKATGSCALVVDTPTGERGLRLEEWQEQCAVARVIAQGPGVENDTLRDFDELVQTEKEHAQAAGGAH
jgi:hypothetical protein